MIKPKKEKAVPSGTNPFAVAGIQMYVSDQQDNIAAMERYATHVKQRFPWVDMLLFSELACFGSHPEKAVPLPGEVEARLCDIARRHGLWLIPGSLFEQRNGQIYNTSPVIDPSGHVVTRFRKLFPFRPYERGIAAGTEHVVFDVPGAGRFGISICYDMWFPETTRQLAAMGAEVILHPTMTDTIDRDVELAIAQASAVTNQCYFFDINGIGSGGNGKSIVVDPSGYVLHLSDGTPQIIPVEIDFEKVRRERERGLRGLGQPLKSFRDREVDFPVYRGGPEADGYLRTLGPLVKPRAASTDGAHACGPGGVV
ncbi:carbon-nitrogen hydrolase family protein [Aquincola sp. S2]|uniref:Carbon-nitrogen hydrolase family protein n=1 Tax=Pseudaquabacterium terrae TaxID=2732868 RepID=A0ABX2EGU1_9BURK|nr:carbon-nitrogen hydrolase family protein [Aquabacterium terrae]NRF67809.1 carbon-nitrogen hydrolase family protein [Aquabacterium terrae]